MLTSCIVVGQACSFLLVHVCLYQPVDHTYAMQIIKMHILVLNLLSVHIFTQPKIFSNVVIVSLKCLQTGIKKVKLSEPHNVPHTLVCLATKSYTCPPPTPIHHALPASTCPPPCMHSHPWLHCLHPYKYQSIPRLCALPLKAPLQASLRRKVRCRPLAAGSEHCLGD